MEFVPNPDQVRTYLLVFTFFLKSEKPASVQPFSSAEPGTTLWDFFLMREHDDIIPKGKMPQLIELFLSEDNFTHVYHLWLGPVLQAKGYDVRSISA